MPLRLQGCEWSLRLFQLKETEEENARRFAAEFGIGDSAEISLCKVKGPIIFIWRRSLLEMAKKHMGKEVREGCNLRNMLVQVINVH